MYIKYKSNMIGMGTCKCKRSTVEVGKCKSSTMERM